jgi:hypothetical protein
MLSCGMSLERRIPSADSAAASSATSVRCEFRRFGKADGVGGSRRRKTEQLANIARPNPTRINTSANSSFFIKSLIINSLKSNRISKRANKSSRINTSENYRSKPFRINTSRNHGGRGWVSTLRANPWQPPRRPLPAARALVAQPAGLAVCWRTLLAVCSSRPQPQMAEVSRKRGE